jgi:lactate dehydrogenase-like 2-hydroxyacid dehydrogenase
MKTLLVGKIHPDAEELLNNIELQKADLIEEKDYLDIEAVVLRVFTPFKETEIKRFPKLKYFVTCSVGLDNIDLDMLKERGIELIHCPGTNSNSVAEHTLYLLLSLLRSSKPFPELKGKTIGIIGFGNIGKIVARKLLGFEAKVIAFDVVEQDPEVLKELNVKMTEMDELLKESDIITIHVPYNRHTSNLIDEDKLQKMKEGSFLINTSRAEVIDNEALVRCQDKFKGIALDVYTNELRKGLKGNVVLTDHVGAQGEESFRKMCVKPVKEFLSKF